MTAGAGEPPDITAALRQAAGTLLSLPYETWNFGDSVAFDAMIDATLTLADDSYARFAHGWARSWATRATPYRRLDCTAPGHAMVRLAVRYSDARLLAALRGLATYLQSRPTLRGVYETWEHSPLVYPYGPQGLDPKGAALLADPPAGVFVDCLHFDPPFLTALGAACEDEPIWRAGLVQAEGYVQLLQQPSGLFDHFVLTGEPGSFGGGWGRGQGWALLGLLDVVETCSGLPLDSQSSDALIRIRDAAARLAAAMASLQRPDGHWYAVADRPDSGDEQSTAAFMAAGMMRAMRLGIAVPDGVKEAADRALQAVIRALDPLGVLRDVSAAVMACTQLSHYFYTPRGFVVPWGQGPAVLALAEALRDT